VPASYLLTYVFFEWGRSLIPARWLKGIDVLLLVGTGLFVLPMILMALSEAKWFRIEILLGVLSLWGVAVLASLLVIPVVAGICAGFYSGRRKEIRSGLVWCRTKMEGGMSQRTFSFVAGAVFGLMALAHVLRIFFNLSLVVQGTSIPMSASGLAMVVMAYLAYQAFRLARKSPSGT
jgi:hypothetical protein